MTQSVYKSWQVNRVTDAWRQLSAEEQTAMFAKVDAALDAAGGKRIASCNCWSTDSVAYFGLEVFPSAEAAQQHAKLLADLDWFRYIESSSLLGCDMQTE